MLSRQVGLGVCVRGLMWSTLIEGLRLVVKAGWGPTKLLLRGGKY